MDRPSRRRWVSDRKDFLGPFTTFPSAPADAPVLRVSRTAEPGAASFRTLEEALVQAKAESFTIIEIRDDGPLFITGLPALAQRWIVLRAGDGYPIGKTSSVRSRPFRARPRMRPCYASVERPSREPLPFARWRRHWFKPRRSHSPSLKFATTARCLSQGCRHSRSDGSSFAPAMGIRSERLPRSVHDLSERARGCARVTRQSNGRAGSRFLSHAGGGTGSSQGGVIHHH